MYCICAAATCNCASRVRARCPKTKRMSIVRSRTCTCPPRACWMFRLCLGAISSSKTTVVTPVEATICAISCSFPAPMNVDADGAFKAWCSRPTTLSPAVSHKRCSSSRESSRDQSSGVLYLSSLKRVPTRSALLPFCTVIASVPNTPDVGAISGLSLFIFRRFITFSVLPIIGRLHRMQLPGLDTTGQRSKHATGLRGLNAAARNAVRSNANISIFR
mmetsp:Transcript_22006/g.38735  ORF Transcript_22006/g.38735 Transcript_22006/m.38735 type:complete len:218 (+) Transcript_22006:1054-1707(+)